MEQVAQLKSEAPMYFIRKIWALYLALTTNSSFLSAQTLERNNDNPGNWIPGTQERGLDPVAAQPASTLTQPRL